MLKKDYILDYILNNFINESTFKDFCLSFDMDEALFKIFKTYINNKEPLGYTLNSFDILNLYKYGLTFNEIGIIKGVTKEAIRQTLGRDFPQYDIKDLKEINKLNRKKIKYKMLHKDIIKNVEEFGEKEAIIRSGYSLTQFKRLQKEMNDYMKEYIKED